MISIDINMFIVFVNRDDVTVLKGRLKIKD